MTRLRSHQPDVGPRFVWRTFWRHARTGVEPRSPLAAAAVACLDARLRAEEEAEHVAGQPGMAPYPVRHRSGLAVRALARRGWPDVAIARALHEGLLVSVAAAAIRADCRAGS